MSSVIRQEVIVFFSAVCHGILLTFGYDILRALRRAFVHNLAAVSAEDFLFWLIAGFATFCLLFGRTDGVLRGYVAVGIVLGALLYHSTVSRPFVKLFAALLGYMRKGCQFLCRCLIFPAFKIAAVGKKLIELASKRGYNLVVKLKKRWKLIQRKNENFAHKTKGVDDMAKKRRRPSKSNRLGMFAIAAIVVVLLIGLLVQSQDLADSNAKKEIQKEELQQQIKDEEIRAEEIERLGENINSPENVEKIARDKLGLVYEDDIIFQPEEK